MTDFIHRVADGLSALGINFREDGPVIRIPLPEQFGELEIREIEEGDTVVGLVDNDWHTHADLLTGYGPDNEVDATVFFVKGIFGGEFLLIEEQEVGKPPVKTIEDDLEIYLESLPDGAKYRIFGK